MIIEVLASIAAGVMCWYVNITSVQTPGACIAVGQIIRELWNEMMTAILALLLAARPPGNGNGGPPSPPRA